MKKSVFTVLGCLCLLCSSFAQEQQTGFNSTEMAESANKTQNEIIKKLQNFTFTGYFQTQYQWGEKDASLMIGTPNEKPEESFSRIGVRRGLIKLTYEEGIGSGVFQLDITEKGILIRDAHFNIKDPWTNMVTFRVGIFDRPFGNEIGYPASLLESSERAIITRTLFPAERDMGAMLILQPSKKSQLNFLKLEAGLFAGNGVHQETDSRKDFIGHLSGKKTLKNIEIGGGISYYNGSIFQGSENVYKMKDNIFVLHDNADNKGKFTKREYLGFDAQLSLHTSIGTTQLRAEYLFGQQPGTAEKSVSPNSSVLPAHDTYIRDFSGGYVILTQKLGRLPLSAVLKYDWYDPNTKISGNDIGLNYSEKGDISYHAFGFGMLWNLSASLHLHAFYEINKNETSENLTGYTDDRKDNVFTMRMQYKF